MIRELKRQAPGLVNFVPTVAYHSCLSLPAAFTQPGARLLVELCTLSPEKTRPYLVGSAVRRVPVPERGRVPALPPLVRLQVPAALRRASVRET